MDPSSSLNLTLQPSLYPQPTLSSRRVDETSTSDGTAIASPSITKQAFAIPPRPRRPLAMALANTSDATPPASRLKRLSLLSRPTVVKPGGSIESDAPGSAASAGSTPGTPQRSKTGLRTSVPYSPATPDPILSPRMETAQGAKRPLAASGVKDGVPERHDLQHETGGDSQRRVGRSTETLVEKHADLLTLIAQKERRVHELKEELEQQEASLEQLKNRWTQLVVRQAQPSHITRIRPSSMLPPSANHPLTHRRPTTMSIPVTETSTSSSTTSTHSNSNHSEYESAESPTTPPTSLDQSIANLLSSIPGESVGMEAVESGKRFWATLVKTVSAAAGGTVPEHDSIAEEVEREAPRASNISNRGTSRGLNSNHHQTSRPPQITTTDALSTLATSPRTSAHPANASRLPGVQSMSAAVQSGESGSHPSQRRLSTAKDDAEQWSRMWDVPEGV